MAPRVFSSTLGIKQSATFSYEGTQDYYGSDTFEYQVIDSAGQISGAVVQLEMTPVSDAPVAVSESVSVMTGQGVSISVLVNDFDVDGDTLQTSVLNQPSSGTVVMAANGDFL